MSTKPLEDPGPLHGVLRLAPSTALLAETYVQKQGPLHLYDSQVCVGARLS